MNRRPLNLRDLDAVVDEARALHASGYEQAGKWNLTQVCRHCTFVLNCSIDGFPSKAPAPLRLLIKLMGMKKKFYRTREIKPGLPSTAVAVFDRSPEDDEGQAVEEMAAAVERLKQHRGDCAPNPGFGVLTREEWLEFHTIHNMHHLRFLIPNAANQPGPGTARITATATSEPAKSGTLA